MARELIIVAQLVNDGCATPGIFTFDSREAMERERDRLSDCFPGMSYNVIAEIAVYEHKDLWLTAVEPDSTKEEDRKWKVIVDELDRVCVVHEEWLLSEYGKTHTKAVVSEHTTEVAARMEAESIIHAEGYDHD